MPKLYLIITNISKPTNIKSLLKAAAAFGVYEILVVGQKKFNFNTSYDESSDVPKVLRSEDDGTEKIHVRKFEWLHECIDYIHNELHAKVCGVEIVKGAKNISDDPFEGDTAIMLGNEGSGMNNKQIASCDSFIRIPQYGGGTASLNVNVAATIVLHRFHEWVDHQRRQR